MPRPLSDSNSMRRGESRLRAGRYISHVDSGPSDLRRPIQCAENIEVCRLLGREARAIEQLPYLSSSKIFLQSKKRFWVDEGLSGFATTDLPISQVWDMTYGQPGTRGILQAYPISLHSRRVTAMSEKERIDFALEYVDDDLSRHAGPFRGRSHEMLG